jgi:hypothetical protein
MEMLARRAYKLGAWLFVGIFIGHTIAQLHTDFGESTPEQVKVFTAMGVTLGMEGSRHTLLDFARGNSYGMGVMYLVVGTLLLSVARTFDARSEPYPRVFSAVGFLASLSSLLIALRFHPLPPIVFMSAAAVAFGLAYSRTRA